MKNNHKAGKNLPKEGGVSGGDKKKKWTKKCVQQKSHPNLMRYPNSCAVGVTWRDRQACLVEGDEGEFKESQPSSSQEVPCLLPVHHGSRNWYQSHRSSKSFTILFMMVGAGPSSSMLDKKKIGDYLCASSVISASTL
ncbi:hypothetical protein Syun_028028 [Stephania yunnanensis]|uniref:Uncharacterized protein n=1 Tax=Stephania yunnanensis TaxID=152371 RepID=A0AAP0HQG8_9MAGN